MQIGWENERAVGIEFNRRTNSYLAVTGKPGSGKTQFVKDLLAQVRRQSDFAVNFIFFDYAKGLRAGQRGFRCGNKSGSRAVAFSSAPILADFRVKPVWFARGEIRRFAADGGDDIAPRVADDGFVAPCAVIGRVAAAFSADDDEGVFVIVDFHPVEREGFLAAQVNEGDGALFAAVSAAELLGAGGAFFEDDALQLIS